MGKTRAARKTKSKSKRRAQMSRKPKSRIHNKSRRHHKKQIKKCSRRHRRKSMRQKGGNKTTANDSVDSYFTCSKTERENIMHAACTQIGLNEIQEKFMPQRPTDKEASEPAATNAAGTGPEPEPKPEPEAGPGTGA